MTPGIWVRFKYESGRWDDPRWLNIGRSWFFDLRAQLKEAWRKRYGMTVPLGATPKAWVLSELDKIGVRLIGEEAIHLPYALYLTISVAARGDFNSGPQGGWEIFRNILPGGDPGSPSGIQRRRP